METTGVNYNPHQVIELRYIQPESNDNIYAFYKATELEDMLWGNPTIDVLENLPDGDIKRHKLDRSDISEMFRVEKYRIGRLEEQEKKIGQVIDNLTREGWYSDGVDKAQILSDLCEIFDHTPQAQLSWSITMTVSGTSLVNLDEIEDFDVRYYLNDNLSVDSNDYSTQVDSFDIDYVDSQEWE